MSYREPVPRTALRRLAALTAVGALLAGAAACDAAPTRQAPGTSSSSDTVPSEPPRPPSSAGGARSDRDRGDAGLGSADGVVSGEVTVFAEHVPAVSELDPGLLAALRRAGTAAKARGVTILVTSGWRSAGYQKQLLQDAVAKYGSKEKAARWVATPDTSPHVSGDAVDIGRAPAIAWLSEHGSGYGLCQIYRNEPWHYELRPDAAHQGCPTMYPEPTDDPRMQP